MKTLHVISIMALFFTSYAQASWIVGRPFTKGVIRAEIETIFPLFIGGNLNFAKEQHQYSLGLGLMPNAYADVAGKELDLAYDQNNHSELVKDLYKSNFTLMAHYNYLKNDRLSYGVSYLFTYFEGVTDYVTLTAVQKKNYADYSQSLSLYESSSDLKVKGMTHAMALKVLSRLYFSKEMSLYLQMGLIKNFSANFDIKSATSSYSSSSVGTAQLQNVKDDLNKLYLDPGVIPLIGLTLRFN